jgi:hypothetical protein
MTLLLAWQLARLARPGILETDDFVQYWAATRLHLSGGNPYAPDQMLAMERSVGWDREEALLFWAAPPTLVLLIPLGLLSHLTGRLIWLVFNFACLVVAITWLWTYLGGPWNRRWLALLVLITFTPALFVVNVGQITPLLLLGTVGFLYFEKQGRYWLAGSCAALALIKPQLVYLFWLAFLLWIIDRRAWSFLLGTSATVGIALLVAWLVNPQVITDYVHALMAYPPRQYATPTFGGVLRLILGVDRFWLQFVPPLLGSLWFFWYWRRHKETWVWSEQISPVLVVSAATTPYGWEYDLVMVLPAVIQVAVWLVQRPMSWRSSLIVLTYLLIGGLALTINLMGVQAIWFSWMAPALLGWYLMSRQLLTKVHFDRGTLAV